MTEPSIKLLLVLALGLVWTGVAAASCDDPFDPANCQSQDLDMDDSLDGDECGGPIQVTGTTAGSTSMVVNLRNSSGTLAKGFIVVTLAIDGQAYEYVFQVAVTGGTELSVLVLYPRNSTPIGVIVCSSKPGGINEGPDVVGILHEEETE